MAGVFGQLFRPQKKIELNSKVMELNIAKEILVEVFEIRLLDVDETIQNHFRVVSPENISTWMDCGHKSSG
jgi:hypothetical protein